MNRMAPITTGKSYFSRPSTITTPIPFQSNTYSTKTAPANNPANQPEADVTMGFIALRRACLYITFLLDSPFARAVRM